MRRNGTLLAAIGALCAAVPGAAQSEPDSENAEGDTTIVVTGERETSSRGDVAEQAQDLSRVSPFQLYEEALPRFEAPLCPGVAGLKPDYAALMIDRLRANAARLDVGLAPEDCSPNLVVAFVDDGQAFLSGLEQHRPEQFRLVSASERTEILAGASPVRVWNNIALRWTGSGPPPVGWPRARPSMRGQLNRTSMPEAHDIVFSLVLFDRGAVADLTLTQLADFATMRGLSHTRIPDGAGPMTTILALFSRSSPGPPELTSFDIGYLRSLYSGEANRPAMTKFLGVHRQAQRANEDVAGEP